MKMKTVLKMDPHRILSDVQVVEIWHNNQLLGTVVGADGPGVRIISKYLRNSYDHIVISAVEPPCLEVKLVP
jgi:hypothetical protein